MFGRHKGPNNGPAVSGNADTGGLVYSDYADFPDNMGGRAYAMMSYNGLQVSRPNRRAPSMDLDLYPSPPYRHYVNVSATDVQLNNGLRWGVANGKRIGYRGVGYLNVVMPRIPGQTRDNAAGFHKRGPSPLNVQAMYDAGPGSQPANPGGPGTIAGPMFYNPMSG